MITEKSEFSVVVPDWINKVRVGTVPIQYFAKGDKHSTKLEGATLKKIGKTFYYVDKTGKRIVKNPDKKGGPIFWNLNGQSLYSTNMSWRDRATVVNFYHKYLTPYIKNQIPEPIPIFLSCTISMKIVIYEVFNSNTPDITNMWILAKIFEDTAVACNVLRDDSPEFRRSTMFEYEFVEEEKDRKIVVTFNYKKINGKDS